MDITDELKASCPYLIEGRVTEPELCGFKGLRAAAEMAYKHFVLQKMNIVAVHCDVDVDGISSGLTIHRLANGLGAGVRTVFCINKEREHGIKMVHVAWARQNNIKLMIVVDSSSNELDIIKAMPCDVLVLDHHNVDHTELEGDTAGGRFVIVNNMVSGTQEEADMLAEIINKHMPKETNDPKKPVSVPDNVPGFFASLDGAPDSPVIPKYKAASNRTASDRAGQQLEMQFERTGHHYKYPFSISKFEATKDMSGCQVCYEFARVFERMYNLPYVVEDAKVYQWVGVSLLTDVISCANSRNQWYIANTVEVKDTEVALSRIIQAMTKYKSHLDKSFVLFTMAPAINSAIRAGSSLETLNIILNYPGNIAQLRQYKSKQLTAIEEAQTVSEEFETYVTKDISQSEKADKGYCGVIGAKLVDRLGKNSATYIVTPEGYCKGSFRGRCKGVNYLGQFCKVLPEAFAQGHAGAFGFEVTLADLHRAMASLPEVESAVSKEIETTAGNIPPEHRGKYHIDDMKSFIQAGKVMELGLANARLSNNEEHLIVMPLSDVRELEGSGRVLNYDAMGIRCKAFEALKGPLVGVYPEFTGELTVYIRDYTV